MTFKPLVKWITAYNPAPSSPPRGLAQPLAIVPRGARPQ